MHPRDHVRDHKDHDNCSDDPAESHATPSFVHLFDLLVFAQMHALANAEAQVRYALENLVFVHLTFIKFHHRFFEGEIDVCGAYPLEILQVAFHVRTARSAMHSVYSNLYLHFNTSL